MKWDADNSLTNEDICSYFYTVESFGDPTNTSPMRVGYAVDRYLTS